MNKYELFTMIFFVLDKYWDENKNEELGQFLSNMNPFMFEDVGSAIPDVYENFCKIIDDKDIKMENSFEIAKMYINSLDANSVTNAFGWIDEEEWKAACADYLDEPHKGSVI